MKGRVLAQVLLGRVLLPLTLLAASVLRQNAISLIYLLLLLVLPIVPRRKHQFDGGFRAHILLVLLYSLLVCLAELIFQLYLVVSAIADSKHYGDVLHPVNSTCELVDTLRWIGFERVDTPPNEAYHAVRLLLPDVIILMMSAITFGILRRLYRASDVSDAAQPARTSYKVGTLKKYVETFGELTIFLLMGASGAMVPSVISAFYFLSFLGILIYWSLHLTFNPRTYAIFKMVVFAYVSCHLVLLYVCQLSFLRTWLDSQHVFYSRLFGMIPLFDPSNTTDITDCSKPWIVKMADHSWPFFANPIVLFCTFVAISLDFAYRRDMMEQERNGSLDSSPFRRDDVSRTSEHQLLVNEQQPSYDAIQRAEMARTGSTSETADNIDAASHTPVMKLDRATRVRRTWETFSKAAIANSYLLAFFAMLIWAVVYPSWTAFVFLIFGCMLWLFPNSHKATLVCSPILVVYATALCIMQYVCSINFGGQDYTKDGPLFFNTSDNSLLKSVGLVGYSYPAITIMLKLVFTMLFCVVLRDLRRLNCFRGTDGEAERGLCMSPMSSDTDVSGRPQQEFADGDSQSVDNSNLTLLGRAFKTWISKYFIGLFYILLIVMAIQEPYIYRLVYMLFFLFSAITFQLHYKLWRMTLRVYLIAVAIYSILALNTVYIFSFHEVQQAVQNASGVSDEWLDDLGLNINAHNQDPQRDSLKLLVKLIVPALLLVAVMLQIHIFHHTFMKLTDSTYLERYMIGDETPGPVSTDGNVKGGFAADFVNLMKRLRPYGHAIFYSICRFTTIHLHKVVYIVAVVVVTREASAFGLVLLIIFNLSLFFDPVGKLRKVCLLISQFWIGLIILAKMLFQLQNMPKKLLKSNCTFGNLSYLNYSAINHSYIPEIHYDPEGEKDSAAWLGLKTLPSNSSKYEDSLPYYIGGYVVVLVVLTIHAVFKVHDHFRSKVVQYPTGVTFPTINKDNMDENFLSFAGYLINFAFVRLGLEMCYMLMAIVIAYRQDAIGAVYALLLGILLLLNIYKRRYVRNVWFIYMVLLALLLPAQYFSALGLPPTLCERYLWNGKINPKLSVWLFLPEYIDPPPVTLLLADCIQFLFVALQYRVFKMEAEDKNPVIEAAGDNTEIGIKPPDSFNNMHDFIDAKRNSVDVIFSLVFGYWFWLCITILFITGTQNINLYCFGYLLSCFYFFWHGLDFTIKEKKTIMRTWNAVLTYNFVVILLKTWLQIAGCVFMDITADMDKKCIVPELFSIKCLNTQLSDDQKMCGVSDKEAGLVWDIVCFVVLLVQRRVFMSTYFLVVVCEERSQAELSSRGAELINQISSKRISTQQKKHRREMEQIRRKLEKIRMRTSRLNGGESREDWTHFEVIRSGDSTMFDEASDDESTMPDSSYNDLDEDEGQHSKHNPMKMLVTALDGGLEKSLEERAKTKKMSTQKSLDDRRACASAPPPQEEAAEADIDVNDGVCEDGEDRDGEGQEDDEATALSQIGETAQTTDTWLKEFVVSCVKWIINWLNEISADYRTVASKIDCEQTEQKRKERRRMMLGEDDHVDEDVAVTASTSDIQLEEHEELWQQALENRSLVYRLGNAIYLALIARTEFICYFAMILCHICNGNILSLPLPLAATLWGMLSVPRPAKTFWVVVLSYVMFVVVIKYIFHFSFWPWTSSTIVYWYNPLLLFGVRGETPVICTKGLEAECKDGGQPPENTYYATYELLVLLSIFVHRSVLKRYGLWRNESENRQDMNRLASVSEDPTNSMEVPPSLSDCDNTDLVAQKTAADDFENTASRVGTWLLHRVNVICGSVADWYRHVTSGKLFSKGDYYAMMVLCDFINFLISVFRFSDFGPPQIGNVQEYISSNRIPVFFLILLLLQFVSIVVDRALYLKKSRLGKLIYTVLLIIVIHIYTLFVLSAITTRPFSQNTAAQLWYFIKCIYFGLSAWQIKSGYPHGVLGNFLTTKYSYVNLVLFKAFMICPFLLELRCVMDWMWTKTSMSLTTWLTMEDIFAKTFSLKCFRQGEKEYPTPRAESRSRLIKYGLGGVVLVLLIFVIWFPLVIFSFANQIYTPNPPIRCQMRVAIGGYQDIVKTQADGLVQATNAEVAQFRNALKANARAVSFLEQYESKDIWTIKIKGDSTAIWGIAPPSLKSLVKELKGNDSISVTVTLEFTRKPKKGLTAGTVSTGFSVDLIPGSTTRTQLLHLINNSSNASVTLPELLPRYIKLGAATEPTSASDLLCSKCSKQDIDDGLTPKDGLRLALSEPKYYGYWSVSTNNSYSQQFPPSFLNTSKFTDEIFLVTFSERIAPEAVAIITGSGIIGLYIGMVFVIGQFIRSFTSGGTYTIMFDELPNVDKIMKLCRDLYFVRENGELDLEEELYAKLIFLFRSPSKLIEWTKKTD